MNIRQLPVCIVCLCCCVLPSSAQQLQDPSTPSSEQHDPKLPNGKNQKDEILKADHDKNIDDAARLVHLSEELKAALERDTRFVLSLDDLKKLEEIEKIAKRMRGRLRRF